MSFKSFLSNALNTIGQQSVLPGVSTAKFIADKTTNTLDDKIIDRVQSATSVKNVASGANGLAKILANGIGQFGTTVLSPVAGGILKSGAKLSNDQYLKTSLNEEADKLIYPSKADPNQEYNLPGAIGKWVGPIKTAQSSRIQNINNGDSPVWATTKAIGETALNEPFGYAAKGVFVGGSMALKPLAKEAAPVLAKIAASKSVTNISKWVKGLINGGTEAEIKQLATQLVDATTPSMVTKTLEDAAKVSEKLPVSAADEVIDPLTKQSKFAERVAQSDKVDPLVADELDKVVYSVAKNKETVKAADEYLAKASTDDALKRFNDAYKVDETGKLVEDNLTPELNVIGIKLIDKLQAAGRHDEIFNIVEKMSQSATTKGQAIQALSLFSRVSPEGVVNFAANKLSKGGMTGADIKKVMTPEFIDEITAMSKANQKIEAGSYQRAVADSLLLKKIGDLIPSSMGSKISTAQTLSLLLNPKTITRNIIGNAGFNTAEGVAHNVFSTPLDALTSLFTGKRTKVYSSPAKWGEGFKQGLKEGASEAWQKIDTKQLNTAYDFKSGVFKTGVMDKLERGLGVALKGPDRAFYQATYDSSLADGIQAYAKTKKIVAESMDDLLSKIPEKELDRLKEVAHYDGLYRTFQDPSRLADSLQMVKTALNKIGTSDGKFGLGDAIIKFPRTPANLINRGLAYSPAGFLKTMVEAAKPLIGKPFNQKAFVESFGRAMTGTSGLMGTGFMLHQLGIIEGAAPESQSLGQTERTTGLGAYKVNASALKRFVISGFNPEVTEKQKGDVLYSYDWFQPLAMGVSMGANMSESSKGGNVEDSVYNILGMIQSGVDTTGEQPLFKNITDLFSGYGKPSEKIMKVLSGVPQTFIPTLVKQVRDLVDENQRETYDPSLFNQTVNTIKNKIPFASESLPSKVNTFGQDQKTYQDGSNNIFNVMLNPGFITEYKPTDEAKMVIGLFKETGSESALPNIINKSIQVNGESHKMSSDEYYNMKKLTGILTQRALYKMSQDPNFTSMNPSDQAKVIGNTLTDIGAASKMLLLGSKPKNIDTGTQKVLNYYMENKEELKKVLIPPTVNK